MVMWSSWMAMAALVGLAASQQCLPDQFTPLDQPIRSCSVSPPPQTDWHLAEQAQLASRMARVDGIKDGHARIRLLDALHGYARYYTRQKEELDRLQGLYKRVTKSQHRALETHTRYSSKLATTDALLRRNQHLCDSIVSSALDYYAVPRAELDSHMSQREAAGRKADRVAVSQSLRHIVRDWSAEGGPYERDACFACITDALASLSDLPAPGSVRVLVPGSGLGRLGHDLAAIGYNVTLNEWSMSMNAAYRFLERHASHPHDTNALTMHPFTDGWSHHARTSDMHRPVHFPDTPPSSNRVVLSEGDFAGPALSSDPTGTPTGGYDVVVTYFFIDTARNLAAYLDTIQRVLRPGGYWVNLGPLLWGSAPFVQLSLDELLDLVEGGYGFRLLETDKRLPCGDETLPGRHVRGMEAAYGFDERALTRNAYSAQFFVAQKA